MQQNGRQIKVAPDAQGYSKVLGLMDKDLESSQKEHESERVAEGDALLLVFFFLL